MAKRKSPDNQPAKLPEYGELVSTMQAETASILSDYIRQYVGVISSAPQPGQGIYTNFDRVLTRQTYQELAWFDLYQELERDPHVASVMASAKLNVAGMRWDIIPYQSPVEKKPSARNVAIAHFVRQAFEGVGCMPQHLYNLMDALGKGFAVSEIVYKIDSSAVTIDKILNRPQRRFQFDAVDRSLRLRDIQRPYFGAPLPARKFIVHRISAEWDNPFGDALDQSLYWMWLFKKTAIKFWLQHLNVGASSIPIVQHPQNAGATVKAEALAIAETIRNGAFGRIPDNFKIMWAEAQNSSQNAQVYENFVRTCNDEMSKCVNGQTLTTEASAPGGAGSRSVADVHQLAQTARDVYRCHTLEATLNTQVVRWIVDFNFANVEGYPQFRFDLEDPGDLESDARIVKTLTDAGFAFDAVELSEKFNWTITKKEALKLEPAKELIAEPVKSEENNDEEDEANAEG